MLVAGVPEHAGLDPDHRVRQDLTGVAAGESDQQVVVSFSEVFAPYKLLFGANGPLIKKAAVADCNDMSADFGTELPISARPYRLDSFSDSQLVLVPNENYWGDAPLVRLRS